MRGDIDPNTARYDDWPPIDILIDFIEPVVEASVIGVYPVMPAQ